MRLDRGWMLPRVRFPKATPPNGAIALEPTWSRPSTGAVLVARLGAPDVVGLIGEAEHSMQWLVHTAMPALEQYRNRPDFGLTIKNREGYIEDCTVGLPLILDAPGIRALEGKTWFDFLVPEARRVAAQWGWPRALSGQNTIVWRVFKTLGGTDRLVLSMGTSVRCGTDVEYLVSAQFPAETLRTWAARISAGSELPRPEPLLAHSNGGLAG